MDLWSDISLGEVTHDYNSFSAAQRESLIGYMNRHFPPAVFSLHLLHRRKALANMEGEKNVLEGAVQEFPPFVPAAGIDASPANLRGHALVLTAGGEGERLRLSLISEGVPARELENFTKATYSLPGFYRDFGTLQTNLAMIASFCAEYDMDIPVIVTTGSEGSDTARVIPRLLERHENFGLANIRVVMQDERLHFTVDEKIVCRADGTNITPVTQPDETGGPLMKLREKTGGDGSSALEWLDSLGCDKMIVVQATALYDPRLLPLMAGALWGHDCIGAGILREGFPADDPYGTFVSLKRGGESRTVIIEQHTRNDATHAVRDGSGKYHLPYNTGFYAFENSLLEVQGLPDYATSPKEILPGLPRSPKAGYAATALLPLAKNPLVLTIDPDMFHVLKTTEDLRPLAELGKRRGLDEICRKMVK